MTRISASITYQRYTNDEFIFELRTGINQIHACLHANNQPNSSDSCYVEEHRRSMVEYILSLQVFTSSSSSSRSYSIHCSNREKKIVDRKEKKKKKFVDTEIDTDRQGSSIQTLLMQEEKRRSNKRKEKPVITITIVRLHLLYRFCLISTRSSFL